MYKSQAMMDFDSVGNSVQAELITDCEINDTAQQQTNIADLFSKAAKQYKRYAELQGLTADILQANAQLTGVGLDIGAGPGTLFSQASNLIALDIAQGMLHELKFNYPNYHPIQACAEQLPFRTDSFDFIYSNLAMQWCPQLDVVANEINRVLKPAGNCYLSLVAEGSLPELDKLGLRRNIFPSKAELLAAFPRNCWHQLNIKQQELRIYFPDLRALLWSLKGIGASGSLKKHQQSDNETPISGLKGRGFWQQLEQKTERLRTSEGLPLTYQILFIQGQKF